METQCITENGAAVQVPSKSSNPSKSVPFYNPKMFSNRYLVYRALKCLCESRVGMIECLDAFSASGVMGIQWKARLPDRLSLYMSEMNKTACSWIEKNLQTNGISYSKILSQDLTDERTGAVEPGVFLLQDDCNVVMQRKSFDFIHLDPFGSTCLHLEPAFRRLRHNGILTLTSTDSAALFARNPDVVRRNYGADVVKTEYVKEMAVRIIIGAVVRAAARCHKGIRVLFTVSAEHYFLIAVQVLRGPSFADHSLRQLGRLLHCRICEERVFLPDQLSPIEEPYDLLPCHCRTKEPGKTAVVLGPMWKDSIFCPDFVSRLLADIDLKSKEFSANFRTLLRLLREEIDAGPPSDGEPTTKRPREAEEPVFYYFPAHMKLLEFDLPKIDLLVKTLRERGIVCRRTHFEPTAVRVSISMRALRAIIAGIR